MREPTDACVCEHPYADHNLGGRCCATIPTDKTADKYHDYTTCACETFVWEEKAELAQYEKAFGSKA